MAVGAHQAHLTGGEFSGPIPCESCHIVPEEIELLVSVLEKSIAEAVARVEG